ncbi:MAG: sensor histidine kinase [Moorellales bacterium]
MNGSLDATALDRILRHTLQAIEQSKEEMFAIAESARYERQRVERELEKAREEARRVVDEVDRWREEDQRARRRLAEVSRRFDVFSEEDIRQAYEQAREVQVRLALLQERERQLLARRRELEAAYRQLEETQARAERLVSRVGVVMEFLSSNLQQLWETVEKLRDVPQAALAVIQAQEEERRRLARGIHDGPAQSLTRVVIQAEYCQKLGEVRPEALPAELRALKEQARSCLEELRKIIFDLRPVDLSGGLVRALEKYLADFRERTGLAVQFEVRGGRPAVQPQAEVTVFRIVQEALNNAYKHAGARSVRVVVSSQGQGLMATVEDDGRGFDPAATGEGRNYGLTSMQEWARLANGRLEIASRPGEGTRVTVWVEARAT